MATATCLACGANVAVVCSAYNGLAAVVDGMPSKTGVAAVDFRSGTYRFPYPTQGAQGILHRFHECGNAHNEQNGPGVRK